jgi:hypothetical protein
MTDGIFMADILRENLDSEYFPSGTRFSLRQHESPSLRKMFREDDVFSKAFALIQAEVNLCPGSRYGWQSCSRLASLH